MNRYRIHVIWAGLRRLPRLVAALSMWLAPLPAVAEALKLSIPVSCEIGKICFVQNYVDVDPGKGVKDHACGSATYDGHNGVDFRVRSAVDVSRRIKVIAAAPGKVKGVRDEITDVFVRDGGRDAIKGKECGNGLVIDHGDGWETQYCHMRRSSVMVKPGQEIARGQELGDIGFSGLADFPHLHLSVRRNGLPVDPFLGTPFNGTCSRDLPQTSLWDDVSQKALAYRTGVIIEAGFTSQAPSWQGLEAGTVDFGVSGESLVLLFFARIINVEAGDVVRLSYKGPLDIAGEQTFEPLDKRKAVHVANIGRRRSVGGWPKGPYTGRAELVRGGKVVSTLEATAKGPE